MYKKRINWERVFGLILILLIISNMFLYFNYDKFFDIIKIPYYTGLGMIVFSPFTIYGIIRFSKWLGSNLVIKTKEGKI